MTAAKALVSEWNRMGSQMRFFVGTLAGIPDALMHYRGELLRVIAQMGLGTAATTTMPTVPMARRLRSAKDFISARTARCPDRPA